MINLEDLDFTTRNVVQELQRECKIKFIVLSDRFLVHYVQLLMYNPSWGITSGRLPNREDAHHFVKSCVKKLENALDPCIIALKMQLHFQEHFTDLPYMIENNRNDLGSRLEPLNREICDYHKMTDLHSIHKKIVFLVTLSSGLGNPALEHVYKEADAALKSIISDKDLKTFIKATEGVKQVQLTEITNLVTGIRLFNRDCQKGGVGIEDLPKILSKALEVTDNDINKTLSIILDNVYALTTAVDNCYITMEDAGKYELLLNIQPGITPYDVETVKNVLIVYRQYELFVRKILAEIHNMKESSKKTFDKFQEALLDIHKTVEFKIAIPTVQVFPLFIRLALIWEDLQDQTIALSQLNHLLINLESRAKDVVIDLDMLKTLIGPNGSITDAERLEKTTGLIILPHEDITVLHPKDIENFEELSLEYMGFCAWKLIETDGGLIPGNPNMGIVNVGHRYYVFSSVEAAKTFSLNPKRHILRALELARHRPEFILLMHLEEQLREVYEVEQLVSEVTKIPFMFNNETQTELHPIPTNMDPNYKWNIWDWKRQALTFGNLLRCKTTSAQTIKSRAFETSCTQTYGIRTQDQQTMKENYTKMPKLSNYIFGLRGRTDDNQHIVTLTRPIDESFLHPTCPGQKLSDVLKKKKKKKK